MFTVHLYTEVPTGKRLKLRYQFEKTGKEKFAALHDFILTQ
jgi:hypothetical protein